jgi:transposase
MKKKRTYQAVPVQELRVVELLPVLTAGCIVAIDVAKQKFVVALATVTGELVKLFRFEHPTETRVFLQVVGELREALGARQVRAVMEPTGTYGDALRFQLLEAGVSVWMVSPHRTHDSQAVFDNVRSLHDGKSAAIIARLAGLNLAREWVAPPVSRVRLRALVEMRHVEQQVEEASLGRLEASLARHWPEAGMWFDLHKQTTPLRLLMRWPSPQDIAGNADEALEFMGVASRRRLSNEIMQGLVRSAEDTLGLPMVDEEKRYLSELASKALESRRRSDQLESDMQEVGKDDRAFANLLPWMGCNTAAAIATMADPLQYSNPAQLEKACGLNMREKSSGQHAGKLRITKRGPGRVRQVLYLFALRLIQESPAVRAWYMARKTYAKDKEHSNMRALVAVMRKLVRAAFHVARGERFDPSKLFDLRRLAVDDAPRARSAPTPRTLPRAPARRTSGRRARSKAA